MGKCGCARLLIRRPGGKEIRLFVIIHYRHMLKLHSRITVVYYNRKCLKKKK